MGTFGASVELTPAPTPLVADEHRITIDRVQRIIEENENFTLARGVFIKERIGGKFTGCVCGAVGLEYGMGELPTIYSFNMELHEISGIPLSYLEGASDGFEDTILYDCFVDAEEEIRYKLGVNDGKLIREELLAS